ncbi:unnamed protein product, partial [Gulo gulo]
DPVPSIPGVKLIWALRQPEKLPKPEALSTGGLCQDFSQEAAKLYLSICPPRLSSLPRHHPEDAQTLCTLVAAAAQQA